LLDNADAFVTDRRISGVVDGIFVTIQVRQKRTVHTVEAPLMPINSGRDGKVRGFRTSDYLTIEAELAPPWQEVIEIAPRKLGGGKLDLFDEEEQKTGIDAVDKKFRIRGETTEVLRLALSNPKVMDSLLQLGKTFQAYTLFRGQLEVTTRARYTDTDKMVQDVELLVETTRRLNAAVSYPG
jgi:hypothetical protein